MTKDHSIYERLSYCQCGECLPCLAKVELDRLRRQVDWERDIANGYRKAGNELCAMKDSQIERLREAEHRARCDLIDALAIMGCIWDVGGPTKSEARCSQEWHDKIAAQYPQMKGQWPHSQVEPSTQ